jgi:hypothetical protein
MPTIPRNLEIFNLKFKCTSYKYLNLRHLPTFILWAIFMEIDKLFLTFTWSKDYVVLTVGENWIYWRVFEFRTPVSNFTEMKRIFTDRYDLQILRLFCSFSMKLWITASVLPDTGTRVRRRIFHWWSEQPNCAVVSTHVTSGTTVTPGSQPPLFFCALCRYGS